MTYDSNLSILFMDQTQKNIQLQRLLLTHFQAELFHCSRTMPQLLTQTPSILPTWLRFCIVGGKNSAGMSSNCTTIQKVVNGIRKKVLGVLGGMSQYFQFLLKTSKAKLFFVSFLLSIFHLKVSKHCCDSIFAPVFPFIITCVPLRAQL